MFDNIQGNAQINNHSVSSCRTGTHIDGCNYNNSLYIIILVVLLTRSRLFFLLLCFHHRMPSTTVVTTTDDKTLRHLSFFYHQPIIDAQYTMLIKDIYS